MSYKEDILERWDSLRLADKIGATLGARIKLLPDKIKRLKKNNRSTIWRLEVAANERTWPLILKSYVMHYVNNRVEYTLYEKAYPFLQEFLPQIYHIEHNASTYHGKSLTWVFMEHVQSLHDQLKIDPRHYFDHVVPSLAKLHAHTYEERFFAQHDRFAPWFPEYNSPAIRARRQAYLAQNAKNLATALKQRQYRTILKPYYSLLVRLLQQGPDFFPELQTGHSITHGDLHAKNICCNDISAADTWPIRYIDWEGAEFAPVWFDVSQQIDVLIDYREDWHEQEEVLRSHYVALYVKEMQKYGITFRTDPMRLYKMGYLQAMLEKWLYYELNDLHTGRDDSLLPRFLQKLAVWGKEVGLYS